MPRPRTNPFTVLLGIVGIAFTLTAASYCVSVLRGVRPTALASAHSFDALMSGHGTAILAGELLLLAISTAGSIAVDEFGHRKTRRLLREERQRRGDDSGAPAAAGTESAGAGGS